MHTYMHKNKYKNLCIYVSTHTSPFPANIGKNATIEVFNIYIHTETQMIKLMI